MSHTYTKEDFERMDFNIVAARDHYWEGAFVWDLSPQGHDWWADAYVGRSRDDAKQRAEIKRMVQQYDALYGGAKS